MTGGEDETHAAACCRDVLRRCGEASLATVDRGDGAWPYASLVQMAVAQDCTPLLLLSDLADHTKNFARDDRVSLLADTVRGLANPLSGSRVTVQGRIEKLGDGEPDGRLKARYLARHASAAEYAGFGDFSFYRIVPDRLHLVAGFGRIHWLPAETVLLQTADVGTLPEEEAGIVDHMNEDHSDAVDVYAREAVSDACAGWRMTGIDPEGLDLAGNGQHGRLAFQNRVADGSSARRELVRLVKALREPEAVQRKA